jgi:hypothetical protein
LISFAQNDVLETFFNVGTFGEKCGGFDVIADMISLSILLQPFPPFVVFQALGGVDGVPELCYAADSCHCQFHSKTPECRIVSDAKPPTTTTNTSSYNETEFNISREYS